MKRKKGPTIPKAKQKSMLREAQTKRVPKNKQKSGGSMRKERDFIKQSLSQRKVI
jgi:hypothetical protein